MTTLQLLLALDAVVTEPTETERREPPSTSWQCARCGKPQPLIPDQPCSCGCWWLTRRA